MQQKNPKVLQLNKEYGNIIRKLRETKLQKSCAKVADEYDLDRGNLNRMENGLIDSRLSNLWKVSEALGVKLSEIIKILETNMGDDFKLIDE